MSDNYQICTNCVMDTTDTKITFDENGVCDHCHTFYNDIKPHWHTDEKGWNEIVKIADTIKKEGEEKDFDCIIGMSGGIDSSYLVYLAKEKLGLRPLVFHVDAGWNSQQAVHNIEKIVDMLGLDLYTEVIDWEEMKDLQLAYFKSGVSNIDTPQDHAFFATMYKFATKYNVKYILTGGNYSTECIRNPSSGCTTNLIPPKSEIFIIDSERNLSKISPLPIYFGTKSIYPTSKKSN
jgi:N-acetyl sugar amidotransferase